MNNHVLIKANCGCEAWILPISPEEEVLTIDSLVVRKVCSNHKKDSIHDDCEINTNGFWLDQDEFNKLNIEDYIGYN